MSLNIKEQLRTLTSAGKETQDKELSSEKEITNEPIEGTPFRLIGQKDHGYFIGCGKYQVSEKQETEEEALKQLETHKWEILINLIMIAIDSQPSFRKWLKEFEKTDQGITYPNQK